MINDRSKSDRIDEKCLLHNFWSLIFILLLFYGIWAKICRPVLLFVSKMDIFQRIWNRQTISRSLVSNLRPFHVGQSQSDLIMSFSCLPFCLSRDVLIILENFLWLLIQEIKFTSRFLVIFNVASSFRKPAYMWFLGFLHFHQSTHSII